MDGEPYWIIPSPLILATEKHMSLFEGLIGPVAKIIDKIIPDPDARAKAKLELLKLEGSQAMEAMKTQLSAILADAQSVDPCTSRARPRFRSVMYSLLTWSVPMGLLSAAPRSEK